MNYSQDAVVRDFAHRTRQNLKMIEELAASNQPNSNHDVFEVTQLINSMLGLLVFPQQEYFLHIPETPLEDIKSAGWPIPQVCGGFPQVSDLRMLMRYLRNAIAHFNIEFIADENKNIAGLRVWNTPPGKAINWKAEMGILELRGIVERFIQLLLEEI